MITPHAQNSINEVSSQSEYDYLMENFKLSNQPLHIREEYMNVLKTAKPQYDNLNKVPNLKVHKMIEEGRADISDITGYN